MIEIKKIIFNESNGSTDIHQLELITPQLFIYNVERTPEGDIADARFAAIFPDRLKFIDCDGLEIPLDIIFGLGEFAFKGGHIKIEDFEDQDMLERFEEVTLNAIKWVSQRN